MTQDLEDIGETLHADADRSVTHVRVLSLRDRVKVAIDNFVEVLSDALGHGVKCLVVESLGFIIGKL